mmetsp:Transcript_16338/g.51125  ORF Transcript_16338/g.51125 Transcript_16338/m.51125 type:complete len:437 (+) Transcript_16338:375-1685(+)
MACVVTTDTRFLVSRRSVRRSRRREDGSKPLIGSSRRTTAHLPISAPATCTLRFVPPESASDSRSASRARTPSAFNNRVPSASTSLGSMPRIAPYRYRCSRAVRRGKRQFRCGQTPRRRRTSHGAAAPEMPHTRTSPAVGATRPASIPSVVVLPAPFGPISAVIWPDRRCRLTPSTATIGSTPLPVDGYTLRKRTRCTSDDPCAPRSPASASSSSLPSLPPAVLATLSRSRSPSSPPTLDASGTPRPRRRSIMRTAWKHPCPSAPDAYTADGVSATARVASQTHCRAREPRATKGHRASGNARAPAAMGQSAAASLIAPGENVAPSPASSSWNSADVPLQKAKEGMMAEASTDGRDTGAFAPKIVSSAKVNKAPDAMRESDAARDASSDLAKREPTMTPWASEERDNPRHSSARSSSDECTRTWADTSTINMTETA